MTTTIKLTRGKVALIDDDDFELVSKFKWSAHHRRIGATWYARTNVGSWPNQSPVYLHRLVMNASGGQIVDHIDGNGLNCQKDNLRICTHSQNQHNSGIRRNNTSGYIGVSWSKREEKWIAQITVNGKVKRIGAFDDVIEAAKAYDEEALSKRGEFATLNF